MAERSKLVMQIYMVLVAALMIYAGSGDISAMWLIGFAFFLAIGFLPQKMMVNFVRSAHSKGVARYYFFVQCVLSAAALLIYIDGFFVHLDAQNGLLFLFIPIYQAIIAGAAALLQSIFVRPPSSDDGKK